MMTASQLVAILPELRGLARALANHHADADDLIQATAERALRFASQYQDGTNLGAWLSTIMANEARAVPRSAWGRHVIATDTVPDRACVPDASYWRLRWRDYERAMGKLCPRDQRAIIDGYRCGPKIAAEIAGENHGTHKSRTCRARRRLRAIYGTDQ